MASSANVWTAYFDKQGRQYWHNAATGKSEWNRPMDIPADGSGSAQISTPTQASSTVAQNSQRQDQFQQSQQQISQHNHSQGQSTYSHVHGGLEHPARDYRSASGSSTTTGTPGSASKAPRTPDFGAIAATSSALVNTVRLGSGIPSSSSVSRAPSTGGVPAQRSPGITQHKSSDVDHSVFKVFHDPKMIPAAQQLDAVASARVAVYKAQSAAYLASLKTYVVNAELAVAEHRAAALADS